MAPAWGIKSFQGAKIAFIGVTLKGTPDIVTPAGVAGLDFRDEAQTVNALVPRLRAQGVNAIVVLVHQGGYQTGPQGAGDSNGCDGNLKSADGVNFNIADIVKGLDDAVDLVISGHTHAAYNCSSNTVDVKIVGGIAVGSPRPTGLPNQVGRLVPVTSASAFGRVLTDIDLTLSRRTHKVLAVSASNRLVDRTDVAINDEIASNPDVRNIVEGYDTLVSPLARRVVGTIATALPRTPDAAGEIPAGNLIADASCRLRSLQRSAAP